MNRRAFIQLTAIAVPGYAVTVHAWIVEAVLALAVLTVGGCVYVKIKKLATDKLSPAPTVPPVPTPCPTNAPPAKMPRQASLDAGDSVPIYNISDSDQTMPDGSLASNYVKVNLESASSLAFSDSVIHEIEIWLSGSQFVCMYHNEVTVGRIAPPQMPVVYVDMTNEEQTGTRMFRTRMP